MATPGETFGNNNLRENGLRDAAHTVKETGKDIGKDLGSAMKDIKDTVKDEAKSIFTRGSERVGEIKDAAMQRGRAGLSAVQHSIETRPLTYIAGALAGGVLLGVWLRRR